VVIRPINVQPVEILFDELSLLITLKIIVLTSTISSILISLDQPRSIIEIRITSLNKPVGWSSVHHIYRKLFFQGMPNIIKCEFCSADFYQKEYNLHKVIIFKKIYLSRNSIFRLQKNCPTNPTKGRNKQRQRNITKSNPSWDASYLIYWTPSFIFLYNF